MKKNIAVFTLFFLFIYPKHTYASNEIILNEVVIDQSPQAVELLNTSDQSFDISNWYIDDSGGTTFFTIPDNSVLFPNSCIVYSGEFNLNKSSPDTVRLFDATAVPTTPAAHLIDSYSYSSSPGLLFSYSRIPDGQNWATSSASLGKFNISGQPCILLPTATTTPTLAPTIHPTSELTPTGSVQDVLPTPSLTAVSQIHISEAMVNPAVGENEWVELYNDNDFPINLSDWYIDDVENTGSAPKQFSLSIPAKSFAVYTLSSGMFNNDTDSVRLLNSDKTEVDSFEYSSSDKGKSIGRTDFISDIYCEQEPSKNGVNSACLLMETPEPYITSTVSSTSIIPPSPQQSMNSLTKEENAPNIFVNLPQKHLDYASTFKIKNKPLLNKTIVTNSTQVLGETTLNSHFYISVLLKSLLLLSGILPILSISSLIYKRSVLK